MSDIFTEILIGSRTGTSNSHQRVSKEYILNQKIILPTLHEQNKIAEILLSLENKIEINNKIIECLEETSGILYKRWFIDFEFPNKAGDPYKSSGGEMIHSDLGFIPKEWTVDSLSTLMSYKGGSQPPSEFFEYSKTKQNVRFVQIRDFDNNNYLTFIPSSNKNKLCNEDDFLIARYGASLGQICRGISGAYNVALAKVIPQKTEYKEYLYWFLKSDFFYQKINQSGGRSAQAGFNKKDIDSIRIAVSNNIKIYQEFELITSKFWEIIKTNKKQNVVLLNLRDLLINKLIIRD
jgi:type I restriction enzyme, S subunit